MLNCGIGEDSWKSLGLPGDPTCLSSRKSILNIHWKDWCWSLNSNPLAIWCKELTYWKRPWCWKRLNVGGKGDDRGWDGWMASLTQRTWVWVNAGSWWWTGRPGVLQPMACRVGHDWATKLNGIEKSCCSYFTMLIELVIFLFNVCLSYTYTQTHIQYFISWFLTLSLKQLPYFSLP